MGAACVSFPCTIAALDVGGTKIAGALVTYDERSSMPRVEGYRTTPTKAKEGGAAVLGRVVDVARELVDEARASGANVAGVGVSAAGSVDIKTGTIAFANDIMPGWMGQPVGERVSAELGVPCAVLNDVHAHALGEVRRGAAQGASTAIVAAAGTGLGGAVVVEGDVFGGAHGFAGMLGHTQHPAAMGMTCACGVEGHLECVASGSGIEECYLRDTGRALSGPEISALAYTGDAAAKLVITTAGRSLGEAIASWSAILDPELVVISGSVTAAGPIWRDALEDGLRTKLVKELAGLRLVDAALGSHAPLVGASERLLDTLAKGE